MREPSDHFRDNAVLFRLPTMVADAMVPLDSQHLGVDYVSACRNVLMHVIVSDRCLMVNEGDQRIWRHVV